MQDPSISWPDLRFPALNLWNVAPVWKRTPIPEYLAYLNGLAGDQRRRPEDTAQSAAAAPRVR